MMAMRTTTALVCLAACSHGGAGSDPSVPEPSGVTSWSLRGHWEGEFFTSPNATESVSADFTMRDPQHFSVVFRFEDGEQGANDGIMLDGSGRWSAAGGMLAGHYFSLDVPMGGTANWGHGGSWQMHLTSR